MLFTGEALSADAAWQQGLVSKVVAHDQLDKSLNDMTQVISTRSLATLVIGKHAFWKHAAMPKLEDAYDYASKVMVSNMMLCESMWSLRPKLPKILTRACSQRKERSGRFP